MLWKFCNRNFITHDYEYYCFYYFYYLNLLLLTFATTTPIVAGLTV